MILINLDFSSTTSDIYSFIIWFCIPLFACYFRFQRPEKYLGDLETWDRAEKDLKEALLEFGKPFDVCVLLSNASSQVYYSQII